MFYSIVGTGKGNEFLIGLKNSRTLYIYVQNSRIEVSLDPGYSMDDLWGSWHKHCFTWKASGTFKVRLIFNLSVLHTEGLTFGYVALDISLY